MCAFFIIKRAEIKIDFYEQTVTAGSSEYLEKMKFQVMQLLKFSSLKKKKIRKCYRGSVYIKSFPYLLCTHISSEQSTVFL